MTLSGQLRIMLAACSFAATALAQEAEPAWTDRITASGDLRLRWEGIYQDEKEDEENGRYRGRIGLAAQVSDDVKLIFRLATGDGNPASTNLAFGDGFSLEQINLDRAYVDWKVNDVTRLFVGKMKNPWFLAGGNTLMWDSDYNVEGIAAAFQTGMFFGRLGLMVVDGAQGDEDTYLYNGQAGTRFSLGESSIISIGGGYFDYRDVAGKQPFYKGRNQGNSLDADGRYLYDFTVVEFFAEYKSEFRGWPIVFYGEWTKNTAVSIENNAFALGFKLGSAKKRGGFQFNYAYHDTEADALIGTFTDSDFAGGNTDSSGHYSKAKFALRDNIVLGGTIIVAQLDEFAGNERDYNRIMIDIEFSF